MISPRIAPLALALTLLPATAMAEDARSIVLQSAQEREVANDAGQVGDGETRVFGQNLPVFDLAPDTNAIYGPSRPLTPSLGTSASFPARTYEPIPEQQSTFGLSIRF